jgi:lipoprotein-releasing system ATP-binding protein
MAEPLIVARQLVKGYETAAGYVPVLRGVDLSVPAGAMLAVVGASGVGKSTLLHVLGALDRPESGQLRVAGQDLLATPRSALPAFRNRKLGFVFQAHHLLPEFSALENVMLPLLIARVDAKRARAQAHALLDELGLAERAHHRPGALSGGEQQRVAVARALSGAPQLLLADEPTGNLDRETGGRLHEQLRRLNEQRGTTIVVVTHNEELARTCDLTLRLEGGRLGPVTG